MRDACSCVCMVDRYHERCEQYDCFCLLLEYPDGRMEELFAKLPALWSIQVGSMTYEFTAATVGLIVVMVCLL